VPRVGVRVRPGEVADAGRHLELAADAEVHTTLLSIGSNDCVAMGTAGTAVVPGDSGDPLGEERARCGIRGGAAQEGSRRLSSSLTVPRVRHV
jgi:hypothetical protein